MWSFSKSSQSTGTTVQGSKPRCTNKAQDKATRGQPSFPSVGALNSPSAPIPLGSEGIPTAHHHWTVYTLPASRPISLLDTPCSKLKCVCSCAESIHHHKPPLLLARGRLPTSLTLQLSDSSPPPALSITFVEFSSGHNLSSRPFLSRRRPPARPPAAAHRPGPSLLEHWSAVPTNPLPINPSGIFCARSTKHTIAKPQRVSRTSPVLLCASDAHPVPDPQTRPFSPTAIAPPAPPYRQL